MTLTDTRIRNAKPKPKPYKFSDGGGMYLLVMPDGARYWRMDYRFAGKRRTLALGVYPVVTLSVHAHVAKMRERLLAQDIDPGAAKKATKRAHKSCLREHVRGHCSGVDRQPAQQAVSPILGVASRPA